MIFLLVALAYTTGVHAQYEVGKRRWFVGVDYKFGKLNEKIFLKPDGLVYPQLANSYRSKLKIENDRPMMVGGQIGYYFDKHAKWGISTGIVYFKNTSTITIDSLHLEYKATDGNGDVFRQVINNTKPLKESFETTNMSVPIMLNFRTMLSKTIGLTLSAGAVYNIKAETKYTTEAAFDYEAIYKLEKSGDEYVPVYDYHVTPDADDWFITQGEYRKDVGDGKEDAYFQTLNSQGYNVALNKEAKATGSTLTHKKGSIGVLVQPQLTFRLSKTFQLNVGPYYMYQQFLNTKEQENLMVTPKIGEYNSMLNNSIQRTHNNYGVNLGLMLFL